MIRVPTYEVVVVLDFSVFIFKIHTHSIYTWSLNTEQTQNLFPKGSCFLWILWLNLRVCSEGRVEPLIRVDSHILALLASRK